MLHGLFDGMALIRCLKPEKLQRMDFVTDQVHIPG